MDPKFIIEKISEGLSSIKKLFNFYITILAIFFLRLIIKSLDAYLGKGVSEFEILDFKVDPQYFSLIYGILFLTFTVLMRFKIRLFKIIISNLGPNNKEHHDFSFLRYSTWLSSPFKKSKKGSEAFWILIGIGVFYLFLITLSHIFWLPDIKSTGAEHYVKYVTVYKGVGYINLLFLIVIIFLLFKDIKKDILSIKRIIQCNNTI
jgi:hypothetical protein